MDLIQGRWEKLVGNAVVYWEVDGENILDPGNSVIAANFTVSALPFDDRMLTATFPPVSFPTLDELMDRLNIISVDIFYAGRIKFPKEKKDFKKFYHQEFAKYNDLIEKYTNQFKTQFGLNIERLSSTEKINLLDRITGKIRTNLTSTKKNDEKPSKYPLLEELVSDMQQAFVIDDLDDLVKITFIKGKYFDELRELYIRKLYAISYENYEDAQKLKDEIVTVKKKINRTRRGIKLQY